MLLSPQINLSSNVMYYIGGVGKTTLNRPEESVGVKYFFA